MSNSYYKKILSPNVGYNQLSVENPFNHYNDGNNNGLVNKYGTKTVGPKTPHYFNQYFLEENKLGLKTNPKAPPMTNTFNLNTHIVRSEKKNNPYYNINNYPQRKDDVKDLMNYAYSERVPRYSVNSGNPIVSDFGLYTTRNGQQVISENSKIPISSRIPQTGQNIYNSLINNNITHLNYDSGIINNTQITNEIENNEIILNNKYQYSGVAKNLNNLFSSTNFQQKNDDYIKDQNQIYQNNFYATPEKVNKEILQSGEEIICDSKSHEFFRKCNSGIVKNYGYYQDHGERNYMEDEGKSIENLNGDPNQILFCLFDGHGGGQVSEFLKNNFAEYMKKMLPFINYAEDFANLFKLLDEKLKPLNLPETGSTANIAYIERKNGKRYLHCANVGDTRSILVKRNRTTRLTYDDRVSDPKERNRIIKQGGVIFDERIYGKLMLSRCFGDWGIKKYGVIVSPHVANIELTSDDLFLIIATDGVWDVLSDEEIINLTKSNSNSLEISKNIIVEALRRNSDDNISCFVISL
jgi:serine/threonine protein phosphatase PrpC